MFNPNKLIILNGFALAGKDTFFKLLDQLYPGYFERYAFADELKRELEPFVREKFGWDVFNLTAEQKKHLRPLLVWYGCIKRDLGDGLYWVRKVEEQIRGGNLRKTPVITDGRFVNEITYFKERWDTKVIKITRKLNGIPVGPPNNEEALNQPLVDPLVDFELKWPTEKDISQLKRYIETAYEQFIK